MVKIMDKLIILLYITLVSIVLSGYTLQTEFDVESIEENPQQIIERMNINKLDGLGRDHSIYSYDVNEKGEVALAFFDGSNDFNGIAVFDKESNFLYGFTFQTYGSFVVEWHPNGVNIILNRSDTIVSMDNNLSCLGVGKIDNNQKNIDLNRNLVTTDTKYNAKDKYVLHDAGLFKNGSFYSPQRLVRYCEDGREVVIYAHNGSIFSNRIFIVFVSLLSISGIAVLSIRHYRKQYLKNASKIAKVEWL